jgi:lipopolysaccharide assembly outer membrane protein LptD (OstA)
LGVLILRSQNIFPQGVVEKQDTTKSEVTTSPRDSVPITKTPKQYLEAIIKYPAKDSTVMSFDDNKIRMYGEGQIIYEDFELKADYVEISINDKEVFASGRKDSLGNIVGKPHFKQGDEEFDATTLRYNFETKKAFVTDVVMQQDVGSDKGFLHSGQTKRFPDGTVNLRNGKFTTCDDPDHPHFYFSISKGKMLPEKSIVAGPAYLVVEDIPLYFIGLPFGYFPQKRQQTSGLVMPQYGFEANRGYYLRNGGWYFAINDNFDLKLTGDIYSKGSWKAGALTNYAKRYKFRGTLDFSFAKNVTGERDLADYGQYKSASDFSIRWSHNQDAKAHPFRTFNANVNMSSSSYDKFNSSITNTADYLTNTKSSSISYNRKFSNPLYNFTAKLGHTQNSRDSSLVLNLPNMAFTVGRFYPFKRKVRVGKQKWYEKIDMRYSSKFENKIYAKENQIFTPYIADSLPGLIDNLKNGFSHDIPMTATFKLIPNMNFTPSLTYQGLLYLSTVNKEWDAEEQEVIETRINQPRYVQTLSPNINLTYNPQIYGFYDFEKGNIKTIRHVMKPSLSFNYRPDLGFDENKYYQTYQYDTIGNTRDYSIFEDGLYRLPNVAGQYGNISFSLGNNLEMKTIDKADSTGLKLKKVKLLDNLSLSTSYDVFRDSMNLSDLRLTARTRILNNFDVNFNSTFDPYRWIQYEEKGSLRTVRINQFAITQGIPVRLSNASVAFGFSLPMKNSRETSGRSSQSFYSDNGYDYGFPWNVKLDYSFRYDRSNPFVDPRITQTLRFSGGFQFSDQWGFRYNSGYDFVAKEITYTTLTVTRQLHCWEMYFTVIPFGTRKSYTFMINVKSALFKDVKYRKEKSWFDAEDFF